MKTIPDHKNKENPMKSIILNIRASYPDMGPSERKIADLLQST